MGRPVSRAISNFVSIYGDIAMRRHYRSLTLAIALAAASTTAFAQSGGNTSDNQLRRSGNGDVFFYNPLNQSRPAQTFGRGMLDNTGIGRPNARASQQVTPVPEPSQWAMMLAGLALVGFIVRRNMRSKRDDT